MLALANHLPGSCHAGAAGVRRRTDAHLLPDSLPLAAELGVWAEGAARARALLAKHTARLPLQSSLAQSCRETGFLGPRSPQPAPAPCHRRLCRQLNPGRHHHLRRRCVGASHLACGAPRQRRPLCVGYQHTSVRAHAHAIRRRVNAPGIDCDPDVVLTLGEITEAALAASAALRPVSSLPTAPTVGRAVAGADNSDRDPLCLVLPDSHPSECDILFRFAIDCARRMPEVTFLLRPHPASKFDATALRAIGGAAVPVNVTLSTQGTLAKHCARARYCLYRGSSAIIEAVLAGVKPFYVARPNELSFDPLYQLGHWRETIALPADFATRATVPAPPNLMPLSGPTVLRPLPIPGAPGRARCSS